MLTQISPKSSTYVVKADVDHVARVIAARRRLCVGEGVRASDQGEAATALRGLSSNIRAGFAEGEGVS